MQRDLPGGSAENDLEIVELTRPSDLVIRTTSGPTPFTYRYRFEGDGTGTQLHLAAAVELSGIAGAIGPLATRVVKRGVDSNFSELKRILEG